MPTIIFKGQSPIVNLKKNNVGSAELNVVIGTGNQINSYINEKEKKIQKNKNNNNENSFSINKRK